MTRLAICLDSETGEPIASDEVLGTELWIEAADRDGFKTGYTAGDQVRQDLAGRRAREEANDPLAKQRKEMRVSEKDAAEWRARDEERRLGQTREGREQLERQRHEKQFEESMERVAEVADQSLGHILNDAVSAARNPTIQTNNSSEGNN